MKDPSSDSDSPKTYVGGLGVHDDTADTGLLYMRQRHYDPTLARFLSRDRVANLNRYIYADNRPVSLVDPNGLYPVTPPGHRPDEPQLQAAWAAMQNPEVAPREFQEALASLLHPVVGAIFAVRDFAMEPNVVTFGFLALGLAGAGAFGRLAGLAGRARGGGLVGLGNRGFARSGCESFAKWIERGSANTRVYLGIHRIERFFNYVGITSNFGRRVSEHARDQRTFILSLIEKIPKLKRNQARAIEQYIKEANPTTFENVKNSIDPRRKDIYGPAMEWAEDYLTRNNIQIPRE